MIKTKLLLATVVWPFLASCGGSDLGAGFEDQPLVLADQVARGAAGVSSAHPLASEAGLSILQAGGNAADAAVAVGFALSVVENSMSGLGGRAQILLRDQNRNFHGIDAQSQLGGTYQGPLFLPSFSGIGVVGVPGTVAGLIKLHQTHGSKPLADLLAPAIQYAKAGYEILPGEVSRHMRVEKAIRNDPTLAAIYLDNSNSIRSAGDIFKQPDLADTLTRIASGGAEEFYRGAIGRAMASDLSARNSYVGAADIAAYQALPAKVITTDYRGYTVVGTTSPANGTAVLAALNVLSHLELASLDEPSWAMVVNHAMALVMQRTVFDDPNDEEYQITLSAETAEAYFQQIETPLNSTAFGANQRVEYSQQQLSMSVGDVDWSGASHGKFSHHTTHYVAVDTQGMMVSVTQTLGPNMGSKVMTPGLGFLYAQTGGFPRWADDSKPGDRPRTNIAPIIVYKDDVPLMTLGAAGGLLIPSAIVQVISRVIDQGYSVADAIAAPRIAPSMKILTSSFSKDEIMVEATPVNGWSEGAIAQFEAAGLAVEKKEKYSLFGRVNALSFDDSSGVWTGVADPDWEGSAAMVSSQ